ncbi:MAG: hypothetical protein ACI9WO_002013 [Sphingobacteriales bacterium]|jgi:hypothetical protein
MKILIPLTLILLFTSCGNEAPKQQLPVQEALIGSWSSISINVVINDFDSLGEKETYSVDTTNWLKELGIKPIETFFDADSTYVSYYKNGNDSLVLELKGRWGVANDTLFMLPLQNTTPSYYATEVKGNLAHFKTHLDWDGDGEADDFYYGVQVKKD